MGGTFHITGHRPDLFLQVPELFYVDSLMEIHSFGLLISFALEMRPSLLTVQSDLREYHYVLMSRMLVLSVWPVVMEISV